MKIAVVMLSYCVGIHTCQNLYSQKRQQLEAQYYGPLAENR